MEGGLPAAAGVNELALDEDVLLINSYILRQF